jgi:RNA polymerase sigma-70 factor (ECF subfamily)
VLSLVRDPAEAEDLTQETFLRALRRREQLRDPAAVLPWLYSVATHVCLDRLRRRARRARGETGLDPEAASPPDPAATAQFRLEQDEMSACVQGYVRELSDSHRAVLLLHDAHDLTCPQIAELLGDSPGSVKVRLHRARKRLQSALESGCAFSCDERGALVCEPKESPPAAPASPGRSRGRVSLEPPRSSHR